MAINKKPFCVVILLAFLVSSAVGERQPTTTQTQQTRLQEARQCRLERLTASQPHQRIESEGGVTELWNEFEDQFQCAGVAVMRNIIQPNSLSLPNFSPSPRLVYIQQGQGLLGLSLPGCAESYHSGTQQASRREGSPSRQAGQQRGRDEHQKIHRIRRGDIVALPAGVAHWCHNDGNEELVAVSVTDLNSNSNQLDQKLRSFYLAGGQPQKSSSTFQTRQQQGQQRETFENIFRAFDENLMAEAFNIPVEVVRRMQQEDERGLIVRVQGGLQMTRPDEEEDQYEESRRLNGLEEVYCNTKISQYLDNPKEADVYSRQAGRLNIVNSQKLPILNYMGMSAEKGDLNPNAMHAPHWSMNSHSIVYVTRGDAHVQVVGSNGNLALDERVNQGDLFVVPQYFVSTFRAGNNGFEYVAYKTSSLPMKSPLVGYTSALKAMPIQVLTNSFQISNQEAQSLKYNREHHTMLLPPRTTTRS